MNKTYNFEIWQRKEQGRKLVPVSKTKKGSADERKRNF